MVDVFKVWTRILISIQKYKNPDKKGYK